MARLAAVDRNWRGVAAVSRVAYMRWVPGVIVVFDLVLPIALLVWLLKTRAASRVYFVSIAALTAVVLAVLKWSILGFWYAVGTFWPAIFFVSFMAVLFIRLRQGLPARWLPAWWSKESFLTGVNMLHGTAWALVIPLLLQARAYAAEPVRLTSPLRHGTYFVITGGANFSVNQHLSSRWDKYALDITRLNAFGLRASGLFPRELSDYEVFGAEIVAPCAGEVLAVEDRLPNRKPLDRDSSHRAGNHVVLHCQGHSILLAHMNPGSVAVRVGDRVASGRFLGTVGNSGNTLEPHLHIGVVQGRHTYDESLRPQDGVTAIPLLIDGAALIRADSFSN